MDYLQHSCFFILLTFFVGYGDGRWKKSSKEILQSEMKLYKKMTHKIKQELEEFYDDYSSDPFDEYFFEEIDYVQSKIDDYIKTKAHVKDQLHNRNNTRTNIISRDIYNLPMKKIAFMKNSPPNISTDKSSSEAQDAYVKWPKFEDILLAIGKKYDWKNDRWIKVKVKLKNKEKNEMRKLDNTAYHEKHNFKYRIVKLNRAKSKRNIVIAVTAIR